jgi:hypothetical protein
MKSFRNCLISIHSRLIAFLRYGLIDVGLRRMKVDIEYQRKTDAGHIQIGVC